MIKDAEWILQQLVRPSIYPSSARRTVARTLPGRWHRPEAIAAHRANYSTTCPSVTASSHFWHHSHRDRTCSAALATHTSGVRISHCYAGRALTSSGLLVSIVRCQHWTNFITKLPVLKASLAVSGGLLGSQ